MDSEGSPRILIIGAGVGGLSCAIALKKQLGFENFTIFEKAQSVGGTWRDNTYPGCSSDIPVHFYSLSTDLNPNWSNSHPFQPEIETYWNRLSQKYSLAPHIVFNRKVLSTSWDDAKQLYHIISEDVKTGKQSSITAHIVISALGILEVPRFPDIPGVSDFRGTIFHSARWNDIDLRGKRVAVIGNGASATQFVPIISKPSDVHLTQFCRTPNWFLPPIRTSFSARHRWVFKHVPFSMRVFRFILYSVTDISYFLIFSNSVTRRLVTKFLKSYIVRTAPAEYHAKIIPSYVLGCKRVIFDSDYLAALKRENLELNWQGIASITEGGIMTKTGEHLNFDVIIFATGYSADRYPLAVKGTGGRTIEEYYGDQGGPTAYLGTSLPGFPNFFILGGPNTTTGHTSVIFTEEVQINYLIKLIKPIIERKLTSLVVTERATNVYNAKIQERLSRSVFMNCISWYRVGGDGKVNSIFPGPGVLFWWWLRRPDWSHYLALGNKSGKWTRAKNDTLSFPLAFILMGVASVVSWIKLKL